MAAVSWQKSAPPPQQKNSFIKSLPVSRQQLGGTSFSSRHGHPGPMGSSTQGVHGGLKMKSFSSRHGHLGPSSPWAQGVHGGLKMMSHPTVADEWVRTPLRKRACGQRRDFRVPRRDFRPPRRDVNISRCQIVPCSTPGRAIL